MFLASAALLIAIGAASGETAEIGAVASPAAAPDGAATVSERVLSRFAGAPDDGDGPGAALIADKWGNLYGTTTAGGANSCPQSAFAPGCGTVFELSRLSGKSKAWRKRVLWSFGAAGDGQVPAAGLIADKWGNLYGTTTAGGANSCALSEFGSGCGTVFELSPPSSKSTQWRERVLWSFAGGSDDGAVPFAGLVADKRGNLRGTTLGGGANSCPRSPFGPNCGTVFELSPPAKKSTQWRERVLWSFGETGDGVAPLAGLIADQWGNLFGTTADAGANACSGLPGPGCGTVFELSPPAGTTTQWRERVLWSFAGGPDDGALPFGGLIADEWGRLYGTTFFGGANSCPQFGPGCGTVFELSPPAGTTTQWRERVLWSFGAASDDGVGPHAGLLADQPGNLYGTTVEGGSNSCPQFGPNANCGTVFKLSPPAGQSNPWRERVVWSFGATGDGAGSIAGLIADKWGNLYGTTTAGGANLCPQFTFGPGCGTVFELSLPLGGKEGEQLGF